MAVYHRGGVKGRLLGYVFLAACLAACGGPASGGSSETAADALNRGLAAHAAGKLDEAVAAHFTLGLLYRQLGQTADAQTELATAQRLDPKLVAPSPSASPARQVTPSPTR